MEVTIHRDGIKLNGKLEKPATEKCPIVIMFHGFTGDMGDTKDSLFTLISNRLLEKKIAVARFDFNGHGKSAGNFVDMDVLNEIEDAIAILNYVRTLEFVSEVYILGHSQGGVVGGMVAGMYADVIDKLVLLAPAATLKEDAKHGTCMDTKYDTNHIPEVVSIHNGSIDVGGKYFRIAKFLPIYKVTKEFQGPALVVHGKKDSVVDLKAAVRYRNCMSNCKLKIFSKLGHGIEGEDQEKAIDAVVEFLTKGTEESKEKLN
ncbi:MAG: alpha/beta fold hydrolase [bacterium]|nr:alpha/beta fold hydrolase [bacterium]